MDFTFSVAEAIFVITSCVRDVCGKPPTERLLLDKYGKVCLCLDEIVWTVRIMLTFKPFFYMMTGFVSQVTNVVLHSGT